MARKSRKNIDIVEKVPVNDIKCYKAAGYVRLSSDDKKKRGDSLQTQQNIIENYIASASDIQLFDIYTDNNATGTNFDRHGFQKMLVDAESGKINCIIVKDLTRLGRNAIDSGYYLERYLPALGVRFIAVTDGYDSINGDGGILLPFKNIISESYALDISRKCKAVQRQNIAEGRFVGRLAPYGYSKSPDDCHQLVINEETAPVIRRIFEWACAGVPTNEMAKRLNAENIPSPSHYNFAKGFNTSEKLLGTIYWHPNVIRTILSERVYIGDMVQGKTQKVNHVQLDVEPEKWVCVESTHEAIISKETFMRVQEMLTVIYEKAKAIQTGNPYSANLFKGKIRCARCGFSMKRHRQNKDGIYWFRCESQWIYSKNACVQVSVKETDLIAGIFAELQKMSTDIRGRLAGLKDVCGETQKDISERELRKINQSLDKGGRMLKSLFENLVCGIISQDEFTQMKADYEMRISTLSCRADEIRNEQRNNEKQLANHLDISDAISAALNTGELTAELVDSLIDRIIVYPNKSFDIQFRFESEFEEVCA